MFKGRKIAYRSVNGDEHEHTNVPLLNPLILVFGTFFCVFLEHMCVCQASLIFVETNCYWCISLWTHFDIPIPEINHFSKVCSSKIYWFWKLKAVAKNQRKPSTTPEKSMTKYRKSSITCKSNPKNDLCSMV